MVAQHLRRKKGSGGFTWIRLLIFCLILIGNIANFWDDMDAPRNDGRNPSERRPAPSNNKGEGPVVVTGRLDVSKTTPRDPRLNKAGPVVPVGSGDTGRGASTGTAFPIDDAGHYLTARHVIEGCRTVGLFVGRKKIKRVQVEAIHGTADVALVRAASATDTPYPMVRTLDTANTAYSVGYPQGRAGGTRLRFLGTARIRGMGRFRSREGALYWVATERFPRRLSGLGGHSGGPVFDDSGTVIGILIAGEDRRGRVLTSRPQVFNAVVDGVSVTPAGRNAVPFREGRLGAIVKDMTDSSRVRKVFCRR